MADYRTLLIEAPWLSIKLFLEIHVTSHFNCMIDLSPVHWVATFINRRNASSQAFQGSIITFRIMLFSYINIVSLSKVYPNSLIIFIMTKMAIISNDQIYFLIAMIS